MLTEDIPPGQAISPRRHPHSDESIFVHGGTGFALLAGRQTTVTTGATIYMLRNGVVGLRNTGTDGAVQDRRGSFPNPAMKTLREISVPEGQTATPSLCRS